MARALGVLLAGGRGARLGLGAPKALAPFAGGTLLARALATLGAVCDEVVVCAPRGLALPGDAGARVDDPEGDAGPLAALVAGLTARPFEAACALAVDLPLLAPGVLAALRERLAGHAAVVPAPGGRLQPLAAWYAPAARPRLEAALARGERAVTRAVGDLAPLVLGDADLAALGAGPRTFFNVNTADDLAEAVRLAGGAA